MEPNRLGRLGRAMQDRRIIPFCAAWLVSRKHRPGSHPALWLQTHPSAVPAGMLPFPNRMHGASGSLPTHSPAGQKGHSQCSALQSCQTEMLLFLAALGEDSFQQDRDVAVGWLFSEEDAVKGYSSRTTSS